MLLRRPHDILPVRRNLQILALRLVAPDIAKQTRLAAADTYRPRLLLGHFRETLRVCRRRLLVQLRAARVHDRFAIRGQAYARYLLALITLVVGYLSRHEIRRVRDPDVALSFVVENPGDTWCMRRTR